MELQNNTRENIIWYYLFKLARFNKRLLEPYFFYYAVVGDFSEFRRMARDRVRTQLDTIN